MLGASWQFELYENAIARPTEGALERVINLREQMVAEGIAVGCDAVQRIFEIHNTRKALEAKHNSKVSNERFVEFYKEKITLNPRAEPITPAFIETASTVYLHMLRHAEHVSILRCMSEHFGPSSPLNSSQKLRVMVTRSTP